MPTPEDWVYVNHFDEPREPRAHCSLPSGEGNAQLIADIAQLIDNLLSNLPGCLSKRIRATSKRRSAIDRVFNQRYDKRAGCD